MQRRLRVTTLYVTHDQTEALTLGDRVVVMQDGRIQQVDAPGALYERPANTFVAGFIGAPPMNLISAQYASGALHVADQQVTVSSAVAAHLGSGTRRVIVGVRPEAFAPLREDANGLIAQPEPATREFLGGETLVRAKLGMEAITVRLFGVGHDLPQRLVAPADALHLFAADSGVRIGL
jgi:multiple sugar transport system ATP-binding protein